MKLKGSRTEKKLKEAFIRELQAHAIYTYSASSAKSEGFDQIAEVFSTTAENEAEHAAHEYKFLSGHLNTRENLEIAIKKESNDAAWFYPEAALIAQQEGLPEIADFFNRIGKVEEKHRENFESLLETLRNGQSVTGRTIGHSALSMAQVMLPDQTNAAGFVHGGELMKLMDNAAGVVAVRHARTNVVTAMADEINFRTRVHVGDLVLVRAKLTFAGRTSMEVQIQIEVERLLTGERIEALTAYYVMVAVDSSGKPVQVPPLIINTEEEEKLFNQGLDRYKTRKQR